MVDTSEKTLPLPEGRILAYCEGGNPHSSTLVIFFHGVFGIGIVSNIGPVLQEKDVHFVAPTLAGWGHSSARNPTTPYFSQLASDITLLIDHLHPNDSDLKLYVSGGSYGTVPAQMLYGAPFDVFPYGRFLKGCLVLAPFSPFLWDKTYTKDMTFSNYLMIGPPSQKLPFRILPRIAAAVVGRSVTTVDRAETFLRNAIFDQMDKQEVARFKAWAEERGKAEGQFEREMAENMVKSVETSWAGFMEVAEVIHSDWGFVPSLLDDEHIKRPIMLVASKGDKMAPEIMAKWLASSYQNAVLKSVSGGHLGALYDLDLLWREFFEIV